MLWCLVCFIVGIAAGVFGAIFCVGIGVAYERYKTGGKE